MLTLNLSGLGLVDPDNPPEWMTNRFMGVSWQQWPAGPSVAMCVLIILAVWTTAGTFMLMFLAAMQDIPDDVLEAATVDGAAMADVPEGNHARAAPHPVPGNHPRIDRYLAMFDEVYRPARESPRTPR